MGFSIEQFKGRFKNDFAKAALFEVFFASFADLRFQATSASLPGSSIVTDTFSNGPYRPLEKAVSRSYSGVGVTFILDNEGRCLSALNQMMDSVVDPDGFVGYSSQYESAVNIKHFNQSGGVVTSYTLNDSFVSSLSDVTLDWSSGDAIATVSCIIKFRSYSMSAFGGGSSTISSFGERGYVNKVEMPDRAPIITERPKIGSTSSGSQSGRPPIGSISSGPQID